MSKQWKIVRRKIFFCTLRLTLGIQEKFTQQDLNNISFKICVLSFNNSTRTFKKLSNFN